MVRRGSSLRLKRPNLVELTLSAFNPIMIIGEGSFGKVMLAELRSNPGKKYAIKVIRKDKLLQTNQIDSTALEKDILLAADHPFLCGMEYLF